MRRDAQTQQSPPFIEGLGCKPAGCAVKVVKLNLGGLCLSWIQDSGLGKP